MEIITKIKDGLHQDNNIYDQPDLTMRDNLNGVITDLGSGNFKWSDIKGNLIAFTIGASDRYMSHCKIKDRLFIITLSTNNLTVKLLEITITNYIGSISTIVTWDNSDLNLSFTYPIRTMWGFYENVNIQRIYWSDFNNPPRCVNIANLPSTTKFLDYFPVIDKVYGRITNTEFITGGSIKAGTLFLTWRYYTDDGYYTDWSPLSNPITVTGGSYGNTRDSYQEYEGMAPNENTLKKLVIEISDIDSEYNNIQVAVFYSNDYNISSPGVIFYDGIISTDVMSFTYSGTENGGTVTIDDLIEVSIKIDSFKDSTVAKKQNVVSCINERAELNLGSYIECDIKVGIKALPLDIAGYPDKLSSAIDQKALTAIYSTTTDETYHNLRRGQWYMAITQVVWNDGSGPITIPINNVFYVSIASASITWVSGTFKAIILKVKYLLPGGMIGGDMNTDYRFEYEYLNDEFYDWKSQKISKSFKSYPHGEVIRLGVLFFDKTGRPFQVRHLRNVDVTYGGNGDTTIPKRSNSNPMLSLSDWTAVGTDGYYQNACGRLQHLIVSDLDITDVADRIGGFMIVRSPIIHQYLGMGVLVPTYLTGNDVHSFHGLWAYGNNTTNYFGCYDFYCPEDMFGFKGFVIQPGDEIENIVYLNPYVKAESYTLSGGTFTGFGRQEANDYVFYQKLFRENTGLTSDSNGIPGAIHEIISVTKYMLGDEDVPINPVDGTKLYKNLCAGYSDGANTHAGINGTHSVLILDINDNAGNIKGPNASNTQLLPNALLCAVKRANSDPYGGYTESSIANSVYISTGHFQEINDTILAEILSGGRYIFNEIHIFGGDTYLQLFDYTRLYGSYDLSNERLGHSIIFPVESRINIGMREGVHVAKTRSYDLTYNTAGMKIHTGFTKLEEFNYNDGYSTDNINDYYLPVPFNFINSGSFISRIRFTQEKSLGENRDSFRRFLANDYIDLDPNNGAVTNIRFRGDKLIYWQPNEVGYIPIRERALTQSSSGQTVQLGVGGIFERYDELRRNLGNSHQFGLIESPIGFHWYDSRRKIYISISDNLQITEDSIIKGLDKFFQTVLIDDMDNYDNPISSFGIFGGYDNVSKMVFTTFKMFGGTTKTIGVNVLLNKFVGFYDLYPAAYLEHKDHLYHIHSNLLSAYSHGRGTYMNFFGTQYNAYVQIVIKENSNAAKIFDTFELISSANFFNKILFENSSQSIEETICDYLGSILILSNRDYIYRNRRWYGSFPKVSRERLNDGYLLVTFKLDDPILVELFEMISTVRKNY